MPIPDYLVTTASLQLSARPSFLMTSVEESLASPMRGMEDSRTWMQRIFLTGLNQPTPKREGPRSPFGHCCLEFGAIILICWAWRYWSATKRKYLAQRKAKPPRSEGKLGCRSEYHIRLLKIVRQK